jgi:hypothetical protein
VLSVYGSSSRDRHTQQDGRGSHSGSVGYMEDGRKQAGTRAHTEERSTPGYKGTRAWVGGSPCSPWVGWSVPLLGWWLRLGSCAWVGYIGMAICPYMSVYVLYR